MNDWRPVFRQARASLYLLFAILLFCLGLFFGSSHVRDRLALELAQEQANIVTAQENLTQKQKELDNVRSNIEKFQKLQQQGLTGTARREDWIEQLLATRKQLGFAEDTLSYTLKEPASANPAPEQEAAEETQDGTQPAPLAHNLELKLRHIHEEELLAFLNTYQENARGRFRIQSCRLGEPSDQGLAAECTLRFFTLPTNAKPNGKPE